MRGTPPLVPRKPHPMHRLGLRACGLWGAAALGTQPLLYPARTCKHACKGSVATTNSTSAAAPPPPLCRQAGTSACTVPARPPARLTRHECSSTEMLMHVKAASVAGVVASVAGVAAVGLCAATLLPSCGARKAAGQGTVRGCEVR